LLSIIASYPHHRSLAVLVSRIETEGPAALAAAVKTRAAALSHLAAAATGAARDASATTQQKGDSEEDRMLKLAGLSTATDDADADADADAGSGGHRVEKIHDLFTLSAESAAAINGEGGLTGAVAGDGHGDGQTDGVDLDAMSAWFVVDDLGDNVVGGTYDDGNDDDAAAANSDDDDGQEAEDDGADAGANVYEDTVGDRADVRIKIPYKFRYISAICSIMITALVFTVSFFLLATIRKAMFLTMFISPCFLLFFHRPVSSARTPRPSAPLRPSPPSPSPSPRTRRTRTRTLTTRTRMRRRATARVRWRAPLPPPPVPAQTTTGTRMRTTPTRLMMMMMRAA